MHGPRNQGQQVACTQGHVVLELSNCKVSTGATQSMSSEGDGRAGAELEGSLFWKLFFFLKCFEGNSLILSIPSKWSTIYPFRARQSQQTFSVKDKRANTLDSSGQMVSVKITHPCSCSTKTATDNM